MLNRRKVSFNVKIYRDHKLSLPYDGRILLAASLSLSKSFLTARAPLSLSTVLDPAITIPSEAVLIWLMVPGFSSPLGESSRMIVLTLRSGNTEEAVEGRADVRKIPRSAQGPIRVSVVRQSHHRTTGAAAPLETSHGRGWIT